VDYPEITQIDGKSHVLEIPEFFSKKLEFQKNLMGWPDGHRTARVSHHLKLVNRISASTDFDLLIRWLIPKPLSFSESIRRCRVDDKTLERISKWPHRVTQINHRVYE
jgi:hypothetical protein